MIFDRVRRRFEICPDISTGNVTAEAIQAFEAALEAFLLPFGKTDESYQGWGKPNYDSIYDETRCLLHDAGWMGRSVKDKDVLRSTSISMDLQLPAREAWTLPLHRPMDIPVFQLEHARRFQQQMHEEAAEITDTRIREQLWVHDACGESCVSVKYRNRRDRLVETFDVLLGFTNDFRRLAFEALHLDITRYRFRGSLRSSSTFAHNALDAFTCKGVVQKGFGRDRRNQEMRAAISHLALQEHCEIMDIPHLPVFMRSRLYETNP